MKRYIAPIIITAITVLYSVCIVMFFMLSQLSPPWYITLLLIAGPLLGAVLIVVVLIQRIKEIKGGEEDAASKY